MSKRGARFVSTLALSLMTLATTASAFQGQVQLGPSGGQARTSGTGVTGQSLVDAPEIDPSLLTGVIVLLVGGVLVLTARLRRRARAH